MIQEIVAKCQTEQHGNYDAVGLFGVVHLFNGGMKQYLCAQCAKNYGSPISVEAHEWIKANREGDS